MNGIHLSVVTAERIALDMTVSYVNIPTPEGSVGVLTGHTPMLCAVKEGALRYCCGEEGDMRSIQVGSGIANVDRGEVTLLVSSALSDEE